MKHYVVCKISLYLSKHTTIISLYNSILPEALNQFSGVCGGFPIAAAGIYRKQEFMAMHRVQRFVAVCYWSTTHVVVELVSTERAEQDGQRTIRFVPL